MDLPGLKSLATRHLRFLWCLRTSGDFANLPVGKIKLCLPSDEVLASFGILSDQVNWACQEIILVPGGRWAVCFVIEDTDGVSPRILLCWDILGVPDENVSVLPSAPIRIDLELVRQPQCSISWQKDHGSFLICLWEYVGFA